MSKLTNEEEELVRSVEAGEWQTVPEREKELARYRGYAEATFRRDQQINIPISSKDLTALQKRALQEGISYQTLVSSILHKYVAGRLTEESA